MGNIATAGYDAQGRLNVTLFDAKSYDIESFDRRNHGRYTLRYVEASLNRDTVYAAEGSKIVCIFVNDACHAPVVEALASLGIELVALRCAGFNNVDLKACRFSSQKRILCGTSDRARFAAPGQTWGGLAAFGEPL